MADTDVNTTELHILAAINEMNEHIRNLANRDTFPQLALGASNELKRLELLQDQPIPGHKRIVVPRDGYGTLNQLAQNTPVLLLPARAARLGGRITTNADPASPVSLLLVPQEQSNDAAARPRILISSQQGWDLKFGDVLWTGAVVALDTFATTPNVAVAEI